MTLPPKIATLKILDECKVAVIGLTKSEYDFLYNKYGIFVDGYFFNPYFKTGPWDGKKRFFSQTGLTFFNLLPELIPSIKQMGYKIKLIDKRQPVNLSLPIVDKDHLSHMGWTLGDHQVNAINAVVQNNGGIIKAATGAGKTLITGIICDLYNKHAGLKTIVIVPKSDLISQTIAEIEEIGVDVGEYSGTNKDVDHLNVVSTWQALQHNPKILSLFQVVIVDECHGAKSQQLQKLVVDSAAHAFVRIGLTGTIPEDPCDAMCVKVALGEVLYEISARELIDTGWLAKLNIIIYSLQEDLTKEWEEYHAVNPNDERITSYRTFKTNCFADFADECAYLRGKEIRNRFISDLITETSEGEKGNSFVLVKSVPYGRKLAKLIPNAIFVYGADKKKVRRKIYDLFDTHDNLTVISTFQLASTGLNIKRIFHLFFIDAGKSFIEIIQSIGRGLRKAHDKCSVTVHDISSDLKYSSKHRKSRMKSYDKQQYKYKLRDKIKYEAMYADDLFVDLVE